MSAVQPCDFSSSWVSSNILVFSQPTAPPPPPLLVHRVLLASLANCKWCVEKQVLMSVTFLVLGSYIAKCRPALFRGNTLADGWLDPSWHQAGFSGGRTEEVNHTRPSSSNIALWTCDLLSQIGSSPQKTDGFGILGAAAGGVLGAR